MNQRTTLAVLLAALPLATPSFVYAEDVTATLQKQINEDAKASKVTLIDKMMSINKTLSVPSGAKIHFGANGGIRPDAGAFMRNGDPIFLVKNAHDVVISGEVGSVLSLSKDEYSGAEWGHIFTVMTSKNVVIKTLKLKNAGGDGIYISGDENPSSNVDIDGLDIDGCARNGISIINADHVSIRNTSIENTGPGAKGAAAKGPWYAIDVEPNNNMQFANDIVVDNLQTRGNVGGGVSLSYQFHDQSSHHYSTTVSNWISDGDGTNKGGIGRAGGFGAAIRLSDLNPHAKSYNISAEFRNVQINNPLHEAIFVRNWSKNNAGSVIFHDIKIANASEGNGGIGLSCSGDPYKAFKEIELFNISKDGKRLDISSINKSGPGCDWHGLHVN